MYGYPEIVKTDALKKADEDFIKTVVAELGSREKASRAYSFWGIEYEGKGDAANAMRRYNQSWLLNPNYYGPYWGFGSLLLAQGKAAEAAIHYEKALSLIDVDSAKPRLLSDASTAYTAQGLTATDKIKSAEFFGKANSLLNEAIKLDPKFGFAYRAWAKSLYSEGNYVKAWEMVKKSRGLAGGELDSGFIDMLSKKMPEPK
jgi:tetratricopeptide (TPR) repeat protein